MGGAKQKRGKWMKTASVLLGLCLALCAAVPAQDQPQHRQRIGPSGLIWDIWCVDNTTDWSNVLVAHESGWTLEDSQELPGGNFHCMAFYSSSESYSSIAFATVFQTDNWGLSMDPYLGNSRYFRLDSWTPVEPGELEVHYMVFAKRGSR
jgi:hypothetical protein